MLALFSSLVPLGASSAIARNGGQGEGNGGGRGGGGKGRSGRSGGSNGDNDGDDRGARDARGGDRNSGLSIGAKSKQSRPQGDAVSTDNGNITVRHRSGIAEEVNDRGRYVMRDRSGRTIVNRAATRSDLDRLRSLIK